MGKLNGSHRSLFALSVLAVVLTVVGAGFLVKATVELVRSGCPLSIIGILLWGGLGLISCFIAAIVLVAIGYRTRRWKLIGTALGSLVIGLVVSYFVVVPWATGRRIARHQQIMLGAGIPILNAMVASVEEWRAKTGGIPVDENEFLEVIGDHDLHRLESLRCCSGITYEKLDSQDYHLRYFAMDVDYVYDSRNVAVGWHPVMKKD